ncbi:retrotransposon protein, putative, unclassified [Tanacetum coccineum]
MCFLQSTSRSEYRWTKDHPLNSASSWKSIQASAKPRRTLATDHEMSTQDELHQFDNYKGLENSRLKNPFGKNGYAQKREEIYVAQPDEFVDLDHPDKVYRLRKALYGLKQAPRARCDELSKFLISKGFTKDPPIPNRYLYQSCQIYFRDSERHGMEKGKSIGTPMATKPKLDADLSGAPVDQTDYRSKIESLMYLTSSRPDIVQAFLGDKRVSWMSKKQDCTAMSSAKAEYMALSASWMSSNVDGDTTSRLWLQLQKNTVVLRLSVSHSNIINPVQHSHTKHIHTRYHFIKEQVENGIIELYFVRTEYQLADMFTKALPEERFQYLVRRIGMRCLTPAELEVLTKESA